MVSVKNGNDHNQWSIFTDPLMEKMPVDADGFSEHGRTNGFVMIGFRENEGKLQEKPWGYDGYDPCRWENCRKTPMGNSLHLM